MIATAMSDTKKPRPKRVRHICYQGEKITALYEAINGNGHEGMKVTLARQEEHIKTLAENVGNMNIKYDETLKALMSIQHAFGNYKAEANGEDKERERFRRLQQQAKSHKKWKIGLAITTILSILGLLVAVYLDMKDSREIKDLLKENQRIEKTK